MAVCLINKNNQTNYCEFSYDDWDLDSDSIPTLNSAGKDNLSTIKYCCQGSIAIGTDGTMKILTGNNERIDY